MEKWDVYDKNGNLTGRTKTRNDIFEEGEYHLGASVWIVNHKGELLLQKRAATKRIHPNKWSSTGGSVISGETSIQGCIREAKEEVGIQINENDLVFLSRGLGKNSIYDSYAIVQEFPIENAVFQPNEVSEVKWATIEEIKQLFYAGLFMLGDISHLDKVIKFVNEHMEYISNI